MTMLIVMYFMNTRMAFDFSPTITSVPPHVDEDGDQVGAKISLHPFGQRGDERTYFSLSVDEADRLARHLWQIVTDVRNGRYTD